MTQDTDLVRFMEKYYATVFQGILNSALKTDQKFSEDFLRKPDQYKKEIEGEIENRSNEMAKYLVKRLQDENLLDVESPPQDKVKKLVIETINKFRGETN